MVFCYRLGLNQNSASVGLVLSHSLCNSCIFPFLHPTEKTHTFPYLKQSKACIYICLSQKLKVVCTCKHVTKVKPTLLWRKEVWGLIHSSEVKWHCLTQCLWKKGSSPLSLAPIPPVIVPTTKPFSKSLARSHPIHFSRSYILQVYFCYPPSSAVLCCFSNGFPSPTPIRADLLSFKHFTHPLESCLVDSSSLSHQVSLSHHSSFSAAREASIHFPSPYTSMVIITLNNSSSD